MVGLLLHNPLLCLKRSLAAELLNYNEPQDLQMEESYLSLARQAHSVSTQLDPLLKRSVSSYRNPGRT